MTSKDTELREIWNEFYYLIDMRVTDVKERIKYRQVLDKILTHYLAEDERSAIKLANLYGLPRCANLHHSKKNQHGALEDCPVEDEINQIIAELNKAKEGE